ncbi:response regulator [Bdellovibrionales bacterium]|nr:response regulator [Bdellovibrionales bacterium]
MAIRLMVADDAPFIREIVRHAADKAGMLIVAEATTGEEAVNLARRFSPDVILMDMVMPQKNGVEATMDILKEQPGAKIIGFSTLDSREIKTKAMGVGCVDFLVKPFEMEELLTSINKAYQS